MKNHAELRVLIVGTYPPPYGGIATHLISLVPGLNKRNAADVAILTLGNDDRIDTIPGAKIYRYRASKHLIELINPLNWLLIYYTFRNLAFQGMGLKGLLTECIKAVLVNRIAENHSSNVVAFYHSDAHFELVPLSKYWNGKRGIVLTVFGEVYGSPDFMNQHLPIIRKVIEFPDEVWATSDHCANSFSTLGIKRSIKTIYLGVDLDEAVNRDAGIEFRKNNDINEQDIVVLFAGRFIKDMGLDVLMSIIPKVLSVTKNVKFVLAGAKGHLSGEAALLKSQYPQSIIIHQDFPFSLQESLYNAANIVVAPSFDQRACMGLSIKEAMAANLAVVATNCGGIPEAVIPNKTGFLVELDPITKSADAGKLEQHILALVLDQELRTSFGSQGKERAQSLFAVETTVEKVIKIFTVVAKG